MNGVLNTLEDKDTVPTEQEKRSNLAWRTQDKTRLEKEQVTSTKIFRDSAVKTLSEKYGFHSFFCCEEEPDGSKLKEFDVKWKIDWLAKTSKNQIIGIAARVSRSESFTIRVTSRGYTSEYNANIQNLNNKDFPINWDHMFTVQVHMVDGLPKTIYAVKTSELFRFVQNNTKWLKPRYNSVDKNEFYSISPQLLKDNGIPVSSIPI